MVSMSECKRDNLCVDCDDNKCWFAGKILSDCPKYHCDRPKDSIEDCEHCAFIKEFQKSQREYYKQKGSGC
jgi:hypothetical protein